MPANTDPARVAPGPDYQIAGAYSYAYSDVIRLPDLAFWKSCMIGNFTTPQCRNGKSWKELLNFYHEYREAQRQVYIIIFALLQYLISMIDSLNYGVCKAEAFSAGGTRDAVDRAQGKLRRNNRTGLRSRRIFPINELEHFRPDDTVDAESALGTHALAGQPAPTEPTGQVKIEKSA